MKSVVIAGYARSPFTRAKKGKLAKVRPDEIAAQVVRGLVRGSGVKAQDIEDVILGCAFPEAEQGLNLGRIVGFLAGLPLAAGGVTVNRFCGSSMQAVHMAAGAVQMDAGDVFVCGGVESMSRVPMPGFNFLPHPGLCQSFPQAYISMGQTAENLARRYDIPRADQERFALASHQKAAAARASGSGLSEIVPIEHDGEKIADDDCLRPETNLEALAKLEPVFDRAGVVTAGTAAPLADGAAAVLVCSEDYARKNDLEMLARIKGVAVSGCDPAVMGIGPVSASQKALARAGLVLDQIDIVELNEAFAVQVLACVRELQIPPEKLNLEGGALALGHPLGASGARITGKAAALLKKHGARYALAAMCIGGGQGIATVLEAV
ncbi:MAG TPA: thiolase family protein [Candidatus Acidoferrales bacterium]|nr:thiolase family protein [Candidatus Acidoferrales bacterium]